MTLPSFYDPNRVGELYDPDVKAITDAGRDAGTSPSANDDERTLLLLVDMQVDFVHPTGALHVPGAVEDTRRTTEWLYRNLPSITKIAASLDSHTPIQIFHPLWWLDENGKHPDPYTVVTAEDVDAGKWTPVYEEDWSRQYVHKLEEGAKKQLMIWPFHVLIGTRGHTLMPTLYEAIAYHSAARQAQPEMVMKGMIAKSEYYSMLEPEVKVPEHPSGTLNEAFVNELASYDRVYITGQAKSHCVMETVISLMNHFEGQPEIIEKLHLIKDATSPVQHPEIDFDKLAEDTFAQYADQGLNIVSVEQDIS